MRDFGDAGTASVEVVYKHNSNCSDDFIRSIRWSPLQFWRYYKEKFAHTGSDSDKDIMLQYFEEYVREQNVTS